MVPKNANPVSHNPVPRCSDKFPRVELFGCLIPRVSPLPPSPLLGKTLIDASVLFALEFYGPVNNEVMSSLSVNSGIVSGQA